MYHFRINSIAQISIFLSLFYQTVRATRYSAQIKGLCLGEASYFVEIKGS